MPFHVHVDPVAFGVTGLYVLLWLFLWRQLAAAVSQRWPSLAAGMAAVAS